MARNRQKAKERQARRKARQQEGAGDGARGRDGAQGADGGAAQSAAPKPTPPPTPPRSKPEPAPEPPAPEPPIDPYLQAGAPPEDVGRSDEVLDDEQDLESIEDDEDHYDPAEDKPEEDIPSGPTGRRRDPEEHKHRSRLVQFLFAVVRELQRVQWPDRQALTTLTGVVLGFVLIAGGYLGALDAIFSRLIQAIL